jgi:hypothetical protein
MTQADLDVLLERKAAHAVVRERVFVAAVHPLTNTAYAFRKLSERVGYPLTCSTL